MAVFTSEEIIQATGARLLKPAAPVSFSEVCTDTRAIAKGSLFVAFKGTSFNGHDFVGKAWKPALPVLSYRKYARNMKA